MEPSDSPALPSEPPPLQEPSPRLAALLARRGTLRESLSRRVVRAEGDVRPQLQSDALAPWTPDQVLQHLERVEALTLERLPEAPARGRMGFRYRVGRLVVGVVFRLGLRVTMPTRRVAPGPPSPATDVVNRWQETAERLDRALVQAEARDPRAVTLVHPVSGPLDPVGTARFLLDHARHHGRQLDRLGIPPDREG
jgi:hypothetical protein